MSKIELNDVVSFTGVNARLQQIEDEFNNKVHYRDNPVGEPNTPTVDFDMNGKRLYNLPQPVQLNEAVRLQDLQDLIDGTVEANLLSFTPYKNISTNTIQGAIQEEIDDLGATGSVPGTDLIGWDGTTLSSFLTNKGARVVSSIASLKLVDKTKYTHCYVEGYYAASDGGGGFYVYDSSDTTSADNLGSIIVANDGGRWKLSSPHTHTVSQFGGRGNGVTDDSAAIAAVAAAKRGPFILPRGGKWMSGVTQIFGEGHNLYDFQPNTYTSTYHTMDVLRDVRGGGTGQYAGIRVTDVISSTCTHQEVGIFSILNINSNVQHHVGMYSQVNVFGTSNSFYYGAAIEVGNVQIDGSGSSVNQALVGLEVDMKSKFAYDGTDPVPTRKTAYSAVAWGGGSIHEAYSVYSSGELNGNGTYQTGDFLYGFKVRPNALHNTSGIGMDIGSDHAQGIRITAKSAAYGINLQGPASAGNVGINIESGYSVGIAVQGNQGIRLNGASNVQQLYYDPALTAINFSSAALSVTNHTTFPSATAGASGALPAQVVGYLGFYVNGTLRKIPFYAA